MKKISIIGAALVLQMCVVSCKNNPAGESTSSTASASPEPSSVTTTDTYNQTNGVANAPSGSTDMTANTTTSTTATDNLDRTGTASSSNFGTSNAGSSDQTLSGGSSGSSSNPCGVTRKKIAYTKPVVHHHYSSCSRKVASHRRIRKAAPTCIKQEETQVAQATPIESNTMTESIMTPSVTTTIEKQSTFTGNYPVAKKRSAVHFGIEGGGNLNNMYMKEHHYENSNMLKAGFHAGFIMDADLGAHGAVQPELRYIMKGGELTSTSTTGAMTQERKDKLTLHYVELPVNLVYKSGKPGGNRFMVGAGPYASVLVNAQDKTKVKTTTSGPEGDKTIVDNGQHSVAIGKDEAGGLQRFDVGANGFIGYEGASGTFVKAGAEVGLKNLQQSNIDGKYYNRNYNFLLTVGYLFGNNK